METKLLWIIPGGGYSLEDGVPITYDLDLNTHIDHPMYCKQFCERQKIDDSYCTTHKDYAKLLTSLGMIIVFNSGQKLDGKYFCGIFLPEELSFKQIEFLESTKELFKKDYHENIAFFNPKIYTSTSLTYKTTDNFRDLHIESIIVGKENTNGQELLYLEIARQKEIMEIAKRG